MGAGSDSVFDVLCLRFTPADGADAPAFRFRAGIALCCFCGEESGVTFVAVCGEAVVDEGVWLIFCEGGGMVGVGAPAGAGVAEAEAAPLGFVTFGGAGVNNVGAELLMEGVPPAEPGTGGICTDEGGGGGMVGMTGVGMPGMPCGGLRKRVA